MSQTDDFTGHGAKGLEGEWLFKASLVVLTTKLVGVSGPQHANFIVTDSASTGRESFFRTADGPRDSSNRGESHLTCQGSF